MNAGQSLKVKAGAVLDGGRNVWPEGKGGTFWMLPSSFRVFEIERVYTNSGGTPVTALTLQQVCKRCGCWVRSASGFEVTGIIYGDASTVEGIQVDGWKARRFSARKSRQWLDIKAGGTLCRACYRDSGGKCHSPIR